MRYITIPEFAYRACEELGKYSGPETLMKLVQQAFDGNVPAGDVDKGVRPVFIALRDGIRDSLIDDDDRMWPCEDHDGVAHVKIVSEPVSIDELVQCIKDVVENEG